MYKNAEVNVKQRIPDKLELLKAFFFFNKLYFFAG